MLGSARFARFLHKKMPFFWKKKLKNPQFLTRSAPIFL